MERPTKRSRTGPAPFDDEEIVGDELNHQPEEVNQLRDPGYQLEQARSFAAFKLKSAFENIFEKYGKDFDGIGDEIDLRTGAIVVDNGHIKSLKTATIGVESDDDDESESESGNEKETTSHGQESKKNATALQTVPRPLPSMAPPSPFGAFGPGYNSFPGGPPLLSNTMYPVQTQFQSPPMPFGAFSSASASIDPAWRAPDLPPPVSWGGFWTPGTQSRFKTVAKVQQLAARTNHDQEAEDDDDILLDVSTTGATKATENTPVINKKLAPFRPPSNVSSPANHQLKTFAATSTPKSVDNSDVAMADGEKKKNTKRKTPAKKTPVKTKAIKERIASLMDESGIQIAGSPVVDSPSADTQPVTDTQPAVKQTPVAEKSAIEGQFSVVRNTGAVKRRRTPNTKTPTSEKASLKQSADLLRASLVKSDPVSAAKESFAELEFETRPIVEHEPSIEKGSGQVSVEKPRVEAPVVEDHAVGTGQKTLKRQTPSRVSTREQHFGGPSSNPSASDSNRPALAPTVEQPSVGTELVVEIQSSLTVQNGPGQPYVQETIARESAVEKTSIDEGAIAEIEPPSAKGDGDQSASISATVTKSVNHDLPEIPSSADSRTARRKRRLSMRDQSSPAEAKRSSRKQVASRYEQSLFNGVTNANTTLKYYSPSRGALVTKPSNQQLWVEIPVDGSLDPKAFQVVVDDDNLIPEVPAMEIGPETTNTLTVEEMARNGVAKPQVHGDHETQTEAVEERSPPLNDLSHEVFTRNVVDSAYAFSDEDEPAIPKARVRRTEPIQPNPKPKPAEKSNVKEFGIPTPASSFDRNSQSTESQATLEAELPMEELPIISAIVITQTARQTPSAGSALLDKTNTNSEGPSLPKPVQVIKARRGRKPKTPIDLSVTASEVATSTPAVTEKPSEPVPIITALASTRPKRQSLRLSRGRRDSDITIAESTTPQHATATMSQHEDESLVIQESPQGTPEPESVDEHKAGSPASLTLTATIPASSKLTETLAPDQELLENSFLEEAIARQRFWSPKPESIILGHEPSPPEPRAETLLEKEPEQPTTPVKTRSRRGGRPSSAASLPTATVTTTTKVKTKTGSASVSQPGRRKVQTPSTITRTTTTTAPMASSRTRTTLTGTFQKQSQVQTPGTTKSTKSLLGNNNTTILSLISSDTDDEDELTLDFGGGTPSGISKKGVVKPTSSTATATATTTRTKKTAAASTTTPLASLLLRTPSRKKPPPPPPPPPAAGGGGGGIRRKTTSLAKIVSSSIISVGRRSRSTSSPPTTAHAVTPTGTGVGSEAEGEEGEEEFVGSEVIQTPGGTLRRCGEAGFRCDRDFCFGCL
ncbi:hypothetical protein NEUTE1DRAFT_133294 [Neurospora tetrasperma FGSC 2508]|uniref:Uncharacterized protein n=1 Tax=Neurospora tetrasperma (strain FGSC 2508 / ATCC MYA-4615 / P0657) TaxID=510951 RepID=F8N4F4_NEUT8|nr:uncharacterized protein NEUTE1DRAFT_133294 [Neurospora tetrasperma FGSC 2508]EGO52695.1 hypothetical protein NEUTE1DRAFT_133294 [Neurospora tetrasperma FGSC 2508]